MDGIDRSLLDRLVTLGGADFMRMTVDQFLALIPEQIASIGAAYERNDHEQLQYLAHKLKGSCYVVGAQDLGRVCQNLELNGRSASKAAPNGILDELFAVSTATCAELKVIARAKPVAC